MKLVTSARMRELEERTDASSVSYAEMMERAGTATARALLERYPVAETPGAAARNVLVLVGPGNNGGDGLVCARALADAGARVNLYIWKRDLARPDANWQACLQRNLPVSTAEDDPGWARLRALVERASIIVDALLGTGVARPLGGSLADLLRVVRETMARPIAQPDLVSPLRPHSRGRTVVVAVDLPTGLNPDTGALDPAALPADLTVTFALPKVGHILPPGALAVGELVIADIGIPTAWEQENPLDLLTALEVATLLPARPSLSNKGTFGRAMLAVGSRNYVGAAVLAGQAAGRVGAGLVTVAFPERLYSALTAQLVESTFLPLPDEGGAWSAAALTPLLEALPGYAALLVGCGFGRATPTTRFVQEVLAQARRLPPLVIDADGLYPLPDCGAWWRGLESWPVLTPHPGEMARLIGKGVTDVQGHRLEVAGEYAAQVHCVVVLKGAHTVIAAPDGRTNVLPFANPALATAGTGDVLAGAIVGLLAQGLSPFDAARAGAFLHGYAGELVRREIGPAGALAGDLLPRLPRAIRECLG